MFDLLVPLPYKGKLGSEDVLKGARDKIANIHQIMEKAKEFRKTSTFASLTTLKFLCGSQQTGKFLKRWEYQTTLPVF